MTSVEEGRIVPNTNAVRLRRFSPIDRDSPILEVVLDELVIFDVARSGASGTSGNFEIAFHAAIVGLRIPVTVRAEIVRAAEDLVKQDESESTE